MLFVNRQSMKKTKYKRLYQYADGSYLPESSQPNPDADYEITSHKYTPHRSTRYIHVKIGKNGKAQRKDQSGNWIDVKEKLPELYQDRGNCCGCTACYTICPAQAILMRPDEEGFLYPVVNAGKCIRCYKCISVCDFKEEQ